MKNFASSILSFLFISTTKYITNFIKKIGLAVLPNSALLFNSVETIRFRVIGHSWLSVVGTSFASQFRAHKIYENNVLQILVQLIHFEKCPLTAYTNKKQVLYRILSLTNSDYFSLFCWGEAGGTAIAMLDSHCWKRYEVMMWIIKYTVELPRKCWVPLYSYIVSRVLTYIILCIIQPNSAWHRPVLWHDFTVTANPVYINAFDTYEKLIYILFTLLR